MFSSISSKIALVSAALLSNAPVSAQTVIADFPQYGTQLSAGQREELRGFALAVVGTVLTGAQVGVSIVGHADFDARGRDFEISVSQKRAHGARAALTDLLREEAARVAIPESRLQAISYQVTGVGTLTPELCTAMSPPLRGDRDEPFGDPENMG